MPTQAASGAGDPCNSFSRIQACLEWVRDGIGYSATNSRDRSSGGSDVLIEPTGFCYAKSHLLAALLRAIGVASPRTIHVRRPHSIFADTLK
jgi:transglutaminase-like putative cysteine protease